MYAKSQPRHLHQQPILKQLEMLATIGLVQDVTQEAVLLPL